MGLLHRAICLTVPGHLHPTILIGHLQLSWEGRSIAPPPQGAMARTHIVQIVEDLVTKGSSLKSSQEWTLLQATLIIEALLLMALTLGTTTVRIFQEDLLTETTTTALGLQSTLQSMTDDPPFGKTSSTIIHIHMGMRMESLSQDLLGKSSKTDPVLPKPTLLLLKSTLLVLLLDMYNSSLRCMYSISPRSPGQ